MLQLVLNQPNHIHIFRDLFLKIHPQKPSNDIPYVVRRARDWQCDCLITLDAVAYVILIYVQ